MNESWNKRRFEVPIKWRLYLYDFVALDLEDLICERRDVLAIHFWSTENKYQAQIKYKEKRFYWWIFVNTILLSLDSSIWFFFIIRGLLVVYFSNVEWFEPLCDVFISWNIGYRFEKGNIQCLALFVNIQELMRFWNVIFWSLYE